MRDGRSLFAAKLPPEDGKGSNLAWRYGIKFTNGSDEQGALKPKMIAIN